MPSAEERNYYNARTREIDFKFYSSVAVEVAYEVLQDCPTLSWSDVVAKATAEMVSRYSIEEKQARSHVVFALRQEGAFVVPPRLATRKKQLHMDGEVG
jgi:hypothetical protein